MAPTKKLLLILAGGIAMFGAITSAQIPLREVAKMGGPDADGLLPEVQIALVRDGYSPLLEPLNDAIEAELRKLTQDRYHLVFRDDADFSAGWKPDQAAKAVRAALDAPDVDILMLQGMLVLQAVVDGQVELTKPATGAFLQDPDFVGVLTQNNRSAIPNLSFVMTDHSIRKDIERFADLVDFQTLYIAATPAYNQSLPCVTNLFAEIASAHGCDVIFLPLTDDPQTTLNQLPEGAQAIYLFQPQLMEPEEVPDLIKGINAKRVPSYAFWGEPAVRQGVLAGSLPAMDRQLARRTALNLQQIIAGVSPNDLPATFPVEQRLYYNVLTAKEIGYDINYADTYDAILIGAKEAESEGAPLTLTEAIDLALKTNYEFLRQQQTTIQGYESKRLALSPLLPQVSALYSYERIDVTQAQVGVNQGAEGTNNVGVEISQIIYSDERLANYRIQGENYEATTLQEEVSRLDTIQSTATAYIRYLASRTLLDIARDNLGVTRTNLNLARIRAEVGVAGPEEVYRFEAQQASDQASVASAESQMETQAVALNRVLGIDLEKQWQPESLTLESDYFDTTANKVVDLVSSDARYRRFQLFSLQYAMSRSPEVAAVQATTRGQEISLSQKKRSFFVPTASANFQYNYAFARDGQQNIQYVPGAVTPDDDAWALLLQAELPIFEGGSRVFDVIRQKAVVRGLGYTEDLTRQLVQQRTLNALFAMESSYADIRYSAIAADRAQLNLDIVTEKYQAGSVSIVDLLDAQNQAFVQKQNAALSIYSFLEDLVNYMRALTWYEFTASDQQNADWLQQATAFIESEETRVVERQ